MTDRYLTAADCTPTPVLDDPDLEYYGNLYQSCSKIKSRMTFAEFIVNPDAFIEESKHWFDNIWQVSFTAHGDHKKMWVNDQLTLATLRCDVIRKGRPERTVDHFNQLLIDKTAPQEVHIDSPECWEATAIRGLLNCLSIPYVHTDSTKQEAA